MKFLLDTHLLLWLAATPQKLSKKARGVIEDPQHELFFSAASIWEVAIKQTLGRKDFIADAHLLRRGLLDNGYHELPILSDHAVAVNSLPDIHKDPFDRMLIAQATVEGFILLTADKTLAKYPGPINKI
jgi:PIN domain nuclease of toxin-antitoxin system